MKWVFIVFCVYLGSLFFRETRIPNGLVETMAENFLPSNLVMHVDSVGFGFRRGLHIRGLKIYDFDRQNPMEAVLVANSIDYYPFPRSVSIEGLKFSRLGDAYYAPELFDRDERIEVELPKLGAFSVELIHPEILGICPEKVSLMVNVTAHKVECSGIHLVWPDQNCRIGVDGFCVIDFDHQEVNGAIDGFALQDHIRPLIVALDVPVALPYMDGFTEVPKPCKSHCAWKIDLVRNDFDLWLELHPELGKYNGIRMRNADGRIHLHNCTRDNTLHYVTTVGPISATDIKNRTLDGTVVIVGTNGFNTVTVEAKSFQPIADVLKIGGFTGDYVGDDVVGESEANLVFRFPRAMTNNYEVLNGEGHISVKNGQLMRMKGFRGLIDAMPSIAPAITWFSDSTLASCDYVIENGVVKTDNVYIEGSLFSIKMYGQFDAVKNTLDFTVRVQFAQKDSFVGKVLHPLTWPFTKLLLEFKLSGTPENPKWDYISVIDRVLEAVK